MRLLSRICRALTVGALSREALQEIMENASPEQDLSEFCRVLTVGALSRVALQEGRGNASLEQDCRVLTVGALSTMARRCLKMFDELTCLHGRPSQTKLTPGRSYESTFSFVLSLGDAGGRQMALRNAPTSP